MYWKGFILLIISVSVYTTNALSKQQMKNSLKMLKKTCMGKNDVTEDMIGDIEKGKFIEDKAVMCYIACIYQMSQIMDETSGGGDQVKNNKLSYEATIKQIDLMYPPELKKPVRAAVEKCKDVSASYKDLCEASFWTAKCVYEADPKSFIFA